MDQTENSSDGQEVLKQTSYEQTESAVRLHFLPLKPYRPTIHTQLLLVGERDLTPQPEADYRLQHTANGRMVTKKASSLSRVVLPALYLESLSNLSIISNTSSPSSGCRILGLEFRDLSSPRRQPKASSQGHSTEFVCCLVLAN